MSFWEKFLGFNPNRKRDFPGQQPGEEVVYMGVFHWITLTIFFLQMIILSATLVIVNAFGFLEGFSPLSVFIINSISGSLILHVVCFRLYNYFLKVMLITNFRLIDIRHTVFLKREREVIPMTNIQDIRYQQNGIVARLFKYGDLIVLGSSSDVKYQFHHVPKVNKIHHLLGEIHQKAIRDFPRALENRREAAIAAEPVKPVPSN